MNTKKKTVAAKEDEENTNVIPILKNKFEKEKEQTPIEIEQEHIARLANELYDRLVSVKTKDKKIAAVIEILEDAFKIAWADGFDWGYDAGDADCWEIAFDAGWDSAFEFQEEIEVKKLAPKKSPNKPKTVEKTKATKSSKKTNSKIK